MPIYSYQCKRGHQFDRYASIKDDKEPKERVACAHCELAGRPRTQAELIPSRTGKPRFKRGIGGFYAPNA